MTRVDELTAHRLRAVLAREQAAARLPSLVAGVVRDGALVWDDHRGEHSGSAPVGPDLQYRIGSITKTMTAVLVMQLRDEGLLDLADTLDQHLPGVGYGDRTIRSLLSHGSGMPAEPPGPWWERSPGVPWTDLADAVGAGEAPFPSGATHHYSNLAYGLLGELVSRVRGDSWWSQARERVLDPLGMERTSYLPEEPAAVGYSVHHFAGTLSVEPATETGAMAAAGQLWSTLRDLAVYAQFLLQGHDDVLPLATLQEMSTPQSGTAHDGLRGGYGLGMRLIPGGSGTLVGHTGSMPGFLAALFVDGGRRTAAVCLANGTTGLRGESLAGSLLEELERSEPSLTPAWEPAAEVPPQVLEVLGLWHWGNTALAFSLECGEVVVRALSSGTTTARLRPEPDGTFLGTAGHHHGERLLVARDADGRASHLECSTFIYTRVPYDPRAPIPGGPPAPE